MWRNSISATIAALVIASFVQHTAFAQAAHHQPYQWTARLKAKVPSAFNRPARWRLPGVYGEASGSPMGARPQRTLNETGFITEDRNLEGYPRPRD